MKQTQVGDRGPTAAYVHIPFCRRRCYYCDFPISVVGDGPRTTGGHQPRGETSGSIQQYVAWICAEIAATPVQGEALQTIFLGGGTPSLLAASQVEQILSALEQQFGLASAPEVSIEMDPGTFDLAQVSSYCSAGINRISLGIQAFQDPLLTLCGRTHRVADAYAAVDLLQRAGVTNWSLDLISGLPQQTLVDWQDSLNQAIALSPPHLSAYDLVLEPTTVFGKRYEPGEGPLPSDTLTATMYRLASETLRDVGYRHYEISNYSQPGYHCRHNSVYWANEPYYGFGMGAASYLNQQRFSRPRTRQAYHAWLETYCATGGQIDCPATTKGDRLFESLMLGLRRAAGVNLAAIETTYGLAAKTALVDALQSPIAAGWATVTGQQVALSDPEGFLFSNTILVDLWTALTAAQPAQPAVLPASAQA